MLLIYLFLFHVKKWTNMYVEKRILCYIQKERKIKQDLYQTLYHNIRVNNHTKYEVINCEQITNNRIQIIY